MLASRNCSLPTVTALLRHGADPLLKDEAGLAALDYVLSGGNFSLLSFTSSSSQPQSLLAYQPSARAVIELLLSSAPSQPRRASKGDLDPVSVAALSSDDYLRLAVEMNLGQGFYDFPTSPPKFLTVQQFQ